MVGALPDKGCVLPGMVVAMAGMGGCLARHAGCIPDGRLTVQGIIVVENLATAEDLVCVEDLVTVVGLVTGEGGVSQHTQISILKHICMSI